MTTATSRSILHLDLDAMFAAVEVILDPALQGKPVIVGNDLGARGVVATASYEARAHGVRSALPMRTARRLCPDGVYLRAQHDRYREFGTAVFRIVREIADLVERVSIDEAFVDLTRLADPEAIARDLKARIRVETGLTASLGLATNKLVAKIASDSGKPDGFVVVAAGTEAAFLAPLPARQLWGVGPRTALRLEELGIRTIGELAAADRVLLVTTFGRMHGDHLLRHARGEDDSPVVTERETKSISDETTFASDEADARVLWDVMRRQAEHCAERLRHYQLVARTVGIKLRFPDFHTITRALTLAQPTDDGATVAMAVATLMRHTWSHERRPLRLVGVRVANLAAAPSLRQLDLFTAS
ncbi:MAG: DNA polymerase IV [Chloroflexi bacterium]|nr:DNA polymerase IV [Chloroflexota bacterium]